MATRDGKIKHEIHPLVYDGFSIAAATQHSSLNCIVVARNLKAEPKETRGNKHDRGKEI